MKVVMLAVFACVIGVFVGVNVASSGAILQVTGMSGKPGLMEALPSIEFELGCGQVNSTSPQDLSLAEQQQLAGMVEFVEQHANEVVHLSVRITQACAACGCPRTIARLDNDSSVEGSSAEDLHTSHGVLTIDHTSVEQRRKRFGLSQPRMYVEGVELHAYLPSEWAVGHTIFLPRYIHLEDAHYHYGEYGEFLVYDGLFVARYAGATGNNSLHFDVVRPTDAQLRLLKLQRFAAQSHKDEHD